MRIAMTSENMGLFKHFTLLSILIDIHEKRENRWLLKL